MGVGYTKSLVRRQDDGAETRVVLRMRFYLSISFVSWKREPLCAILFGEGANYRQTRARPRYLGPVPGRLVTIALLRINSASDPKYQFNCYSVLFFNEWVDKLALSDGGNTFLIVGTAVSVSSTHFLLPNTCLICICLVAPHKTHTGKTPC